MYRYIILILSAILFTINYFNVDNEAKPTVCIFFITIILFIIWI